MDQTFEKKNIEDLAAGIAAHFEETPFTWRQSERPMAEIVAAWDLKRALFQDCEGLYKVNKKTKELEPNALHEMLDATLSCKSLATDTPGYVHWCRRVKPTEKVGSPGPKAGPDGKVWCCNNEAEAKAKCLENLVFWCCGRAWLRFSDHREWTGLPLASRRFFVAEVCGSTLTRGLKNVYLKLELDKASVVRGLTALLKADKDDFSAKKQGAPMQPRHWHDCCESWWG